MSTNSTGTLCWHEMLTGDTAGARSFYTELFGWKPIEFPMPAGEAKYTIFEKDGQRIAGLGPSDGGASAGWVSYVTVDNLEEAMARAERLGGALVAGPAPVPGAGRYAIVRDPAGGRVGLFQVGEA